MSKHLFILSREIIDAVSDEEVAATVKDLKTLDLYHLPYPIVSIRVPTHYAVLKNASPHKQWAEGHDLVLGQDGQWHLNFPDHWYLEFSDLGVDRAGTAHIVCDGLPHYERWNVDERDTTRNYESVVNLLICLLATRNAVKTTTRDKLAGLGIGRRGRHRYEYTTSITLPREMPDHEVCEGAAKAPHLRRGHIRHQHYGPANAYRKMVWIEPCFVNADKDFVNRRAAYNLGLGHSPKNGSQL